MDTDIPILAVGVRALVFVLSFLAIGFFSGSETAFLGMDVWAVEGLLSLNDKRAEKLRLLHETRETTISALLVGTNVFTVLASVMAMSIAILLGAQGAVKAVAVPLAVTLLVFVFAELVPKSYASEKPTETALYVAMPLFSVVGCLRPVARFVQGVPVALSKLCRSKTGAAISSSDEAVRVALDLAGEESGSTKEDADVISGVLDSSDVSLGQIMIPIEQAVVFSPETTCQDALAIFKKYRFSRVPVFDKRTGQVTGLVYLKDVVRCVHIASEGPGRLQSGCPKTVGGIARGVFVVDAGQKVLDVLARMRQNRIHLAVVLRGPKPVGIVTIEDLIEEILGDIPEDVSAMPVDAQAPVLKNSNGAVSVL